MSGDDPVVEPVETEPVETEPVETPSERRPRHRRRVTTDVAPHVDPTPTSEPPRHREDENDDRLKAEKPPHY